MITVRRAGMDDLPALNRLEKLCFSPPWSERTLREMLESSLDTVWAAVTPNHKTAAYLDYREVAGEGELMRVCVDPAFRGRHFGRMMVDTMLREAGRRGVTAVTLEVRASNAAALRLYGNCGFRREAVRKDYYDSPKEDAIIMWRREG
jgi:ribosomal-protein-alanine N-acetyltransferase